MRRTLVISAMAAASVALLAAVPETASATCGERKATGTILGGVGGALLGNSISRGGGGAVIGGLGGAVIGHQIAGSGGGCRRYTSSASYRSSRARARGRAVAAAPAPKPVRYVYYDQYGNPYSAGPAPQPAYGQPSYGLAAQPVAYNGSSYCRTETRSFYDERGLLVQRPMQVCDR